ncbi:MAG: hypothetical protein NTZ05_02405 [Chloroflexi bacterium]|nr:hypothetical protein [Chloroflexota bacterium]
MPNCWAAAAICVVVTKTLLKLLVPNTPLTCRGMPYASTTMLSWVPAASRSRSPSAQPMLYSVIVFTVRM